MYNKSVSLHQSKKQQNGNLLENEILSKMLDFYNIDYKQQVTIDTRGLIVGYNQKRKRCFHIIDFVIGNDIRIGESIVNYKVISCKTTCRERWTQDNWSFTIKPQLFILLTLNNDYPSSSRFREDSSRKIVSHTPKNNDDRIFKLDFSNLIQELN